MTTAELLWAGCVATGIIIGWVVGLVRVVVYRAEGDELFLCPLFGLGGGMGLFLAGFILLWVWPLALIMGLCAIPFGAISLWRRDIVLPGLWARCLYFGHRGLFWGGMIIEAVRGKQ